MSHEKKEPAIAFGKIPVASWFFLAAVFVGSIYARDELGFPHTKLAVIALFLPAVIPAVIPVKIGVRLLGLVLGYFISVGGSFLAMALFGSDFNIARMAFVFCGLGGSVAGFIAIAKVMGLSISQLDNLIPSK